MAEEMTALLEVPQNCPPTLAEARRRFDAAKEAYDRADIGALDPDAIPFKIRTELKNAENCVRLIEALQIRKMKSEV